MYKTRIDLQSIITRNNLNSDVLADELFPHNKYPIAALKRVLSGDALLDESQVYRLSEITNTPIHKLFGNDPWHAEEIRKDLKLVLNKGQFKVVLDMNTWTTKVYFMGTVFCDTVLHSKETTMTKYISLIDEVVERYMDSKKLV